MKTGRVVIIVASIVAFVGVIIAITHPPGDWTGQPIVSLAAEKEMAKSIATMNHQVWPDGTIIHKRLGNGWSCVEIDGHRLLVLNRGRSSFGVAVNSCED